MVQSERSDDVVRDRDLADPVELPVRTAEPAPQRRVAWQQVLGLVVAVAALMLAVAGVIGIVAGSLARLADGDAMADVLAFIAQGVVLVLGSLVVGIGALWLLVRGERRWWRRQHASPSDGERRSTT